MLLCGKGMGGGRKEGGGGRRGGGGGGGEGGEGVRGEGGRAGPSEEKEREGEEGKKEYNLILFQRIMFPTEATDSHGHLYSQLYEKLILTKQLHNQY